MADEKPKPKGTDWPGPRAERGTWTKKRTAAKKAAKKAAKRRKKK